MPSFAAGALTVPAVLSVVATAVAACSSGSLPAPHHTRTSVIWLTLCTLRADHLGAYGNPHGTSPNIDRLAAEGVLFERTLTAAPWTRPSMGAMITGVYPRTLQIEDHERWPTDRGLPDDFETLAERFRAAGYTTIGVTGNPNLNAVFNFDQGYDLYHDTGKLWRNGYGRDKLTADEVVAPLLERLREPHRPERFFAHLVFVDIHVPYQTDLARRRVPDAPLRTPTPDYDLQVRYVDTVIGELLEELDALAYRDRLVVITSDHGEGLDGPRGRDRGHGTQLYNAAVWVPFILHHPSLGGPGARLIRRVETVDAVPTVLDLLGLPFDPDALDGRSLREAVLTGAEPEERDVSVVETAYHLVDRSALLHDGWKLIVDRKAADPASRRELYRYAEDHRERRDRAAAEPDTARRLEALLDEWQRERERRITAAPIRGRPGEHEVRALRALGYVE